MRASSVESIILEIMGRENRHLTAREIYKTVRPRLPATNTSTVYRALDRMAAAGKISVSDIGQGAVVYEVVNEHSHHHLVCQNCKQISELDHQLVEQFLGEVANRSAYQITTNHLVIFGICPECQAEHIEKNT